MVHPTSVTNIIDRLERQGLVTRRPNPEDGRGTLAGITPEGRAVTARATKDLMAAEFGLGEYQDDDLDAIFSLLRGLRVVAGDFDDVRPAGASQAAPAAVPPGASPEEPAGPRR
jgi:DNA-binding MarR family transcriptional regulator